METNLYFNGTNFSAGSAQYFAAQGSTTSWTYNNANLSFTTDHRYDVTAQATDIAGNIGATTRRFVYDISKPTSTVTSPATGYDTNWVTVSGTANDTVGSPANPAGISTSAVQLAVKQTDNNWWNGTNFRRD